MFSLSKDKRQRFVKKTVILLSIFYFLFSGAARAQEKLSLTVTPPLFQLTIGPGEIWQSNLKVVNTNLYDLTVYASVMDFQANGEEGKGKFIPLIESLEGNNNRSLASWIEISPEPIFVPREKSAEVPFTVRLPANAEPGGHYAAILIGTRPLNDQTAGAVIRVSSLVSSLILARVNGEVKEAGGFVVNRILIPMTGRTCFSSARRMAELPGLRQCG